MSNNQCCICDGKIEEIYRSPVFCYNCDVERIANISAGLNMSINGTRGKN